mmetsp:Transcript_17095/g.33470  ORF Transcript_17095/g.33470 Transcript_17095/m.33470 type:complete len:95 (+) Transcript_17095:1753-2037(+)
MRVRCFLTTISALWELNQNKSSNILQNLWLAPRNKAGSCAKCKQELRSRFQDPVLFCARDFEEDISSVPTCIQYIRKFCGVRPATFSALHKQKE